MRKLKLLVDNGIVLSVQGGLYVAEHNTSWYFESMYDTNLTSLIDRVYAYIKNGGAI